MPVLAGYQRTWLRFDLLAGLTTAAVVIPQAVAYASLAGLPVQVGLYVATVPMVAYAFLGTSRPLSVSTTSTISILTASALADVAHNPSEAASAAALLALLVGILLVVASLLHLGFLADFISAPVLAGFKAGMGLVIAASQLGKVLGIQVDGSHFFAQVWSAVTQLGDADLLTVAVATGALVVLLAMRKWTPRVPGPLVVVVLGIILVAWANPDVAVVGPVPSGLPAPALPDFSHTVDLIPDAAGIALMSFIESISAARAFAAKTDPPVRADRELLALGAANLTAGLFQAYPSGGGTSQTAVNDASGAKSRLAGVVTAVMAVLTLTLLASFLADLPLAILGAVVLVAAIGLVDLGPLRRIGRIRRRDYWLGLTALAGVVGLGVLRGVLVAVIISLVVLLHELDHPHITASERAPGLLAIRPEGRLFFANARRVSAQILAIVNDADPPPRIVLLDLGAVNDLEITALERLRDIAENIADRGMALWISAPNTDPREVLANASQLLGRADLTGAGPLGVRIFPSLRDALDTYERA